LKSIHLYGTFLKESYGELIQKFSLYFNCYITFVLVDFLGSIPWEAMGYGDNSFYSILMSMVVGILNLVIIVEVILIEKSKLMQREKEKLLFAAPTYLIYTLYYSILFVLGLLCFLIPGIIIAVMLAMVPLASVLLEDNDINYFKLSYQMAKKDLLLMIIFVFSSLLIELVSTGLAFIPDWRIQLGAKLSYSFLDGLLMIILTMASVKVFYHFKSSLSTDLLNANN
jgi:hypothetical protein